MFVKLQKKKLHIYLTAMYNRWGWVHFLPSYLVLLIVFLTNKVIERILYKISLSWPLVVLKLLWKNSSDEFARNKGKKGNKTKYRMEGNLQTCWKCYYDQNINFHLALDFKTTLTKH